MAFFFAIVVTFQPEMRPDINDAPWDDMDQWEGFMQISMASVAGLIVPEYFFTCQLLTWGDCNLSDTALIYMSKEEMALFFITEALFLPWFVPEAIAWYAFFYPIYLFFDLLWWGSVLWDFITFDSGDDKSN